jgi:hypothetical protein
MRFVDRVLNPDRDSDGHVEEDTTVVLATL